MSLFAAFEPANRRGVDHAKTVMSYLGDSAYRAVWTCLYFRRVAGLEDVVTSTGLDEPFVRQALEDLVQCGLAAKASNGTEVRFSARVPKAAMGVWKAC